MPQALGPFNSISNYKSIKQIINNVDLVFARDKISLNYLIDAVGQNSKIKIAPDFTNLIEGIKPKYFDNNRNKFCIIPNYRMIDKVNNKDSKNYLPFMIESTRYIFNKGGKPFILVHESKDDLILANEIRDKVAHDIEIIQETDVLKIKGIIGSASGVLSSRFHGLVNALSQSIPAMATSWSHKYLMLLKDYDFEEGLIDINISKEDLYKKIDLFFEEDFRNITIKKLILNNNYLKKKTEIMWDEVLHIINN